MRTRRAALPLLCFLTLACPALAEKPAELSVPVADQVRRGDAARGAGKWAEAAAAYKAALDAAVEVGHTDAQRAAIHGELGLCHLALRQYVDAATHLERTVWSWDALSDDQQARFKAGLKKAEAKVGRVYLGVNPSDAEVSLDGKPIPHHRVVYSIYVEPGDHTIRARATGRGEAMANFTAQGGVKTSLTLSVAEGAQPATSTRTPALAPIPKADGALGPGAPRKETADTLRWVGFGTAAVGAALGAGFVITAAVLHGQAKDKNAALGPSGCAADAGTAACEDLHGTLRTRDTMASLAVGSFIGAAVIGAFTASSYAWAPPERAPVRVQPSVTKKQASITVTALW